MKNKNKKEMMKILIEDLKNMSNADFAASYGKCKEDVKRISSKAVGKSMNEIMKECMASR